MPMADTHFGEWTDGGIFTTLAVNAGISFGLFLVFTVIKRRFDLYDPSKRSPTAWFTTAFTAKRLDSLPLDHALYLTFQRTLLVVSLVITAIAAPILVPINNSRRENLRLVTLALADNPKATYRTGFPNWASRNVGVKDGALWAHLVVVVVASLALYVAALSLTRAFYVARRARPAARGPATAALITNLPVSLVHPRELRRALCEEMGVERGAVRRVHLVRNMPRAMPLREAVVASREALEHVLALERVGKNKGGERAIAEAKAKVGRAEDALRKELARPHPPTGSAFVCFSSATACRLAVRNISARFEEVHLRVGEPGDPAPPAAPVDLATRLGLKAPARPGFEATVWGASLAPEPRAVVWANLSLSAAPKLLMLARLTFLFVFTAALVLLWTVPVSFLGSLASLSSIPGGIGKAFATLNNLPPVFVGFLSTFLPVIVLVAFNALLPAILEAIAKFEGPVDLRELRARVMVKFFAFILFSTLILPSVFIGSISRLGTLGKELSDNTVKAALGLITSIVTPTSGVFIGYVSQLAFIGSALGLLSLGPLIVGLLKRRLASTERQKRMAFPRPVFNFHLAYPVMLLVLTILLFFCITVPITTPYCLFFFTIRHAADCHFLFFMAARPHREVKVKAKAIKIMPPLKKATDPSSSSSEATSTEDDSFESLESSSSSLDEAAAHSSSSSSSTSSSSSSTSTSSTATLAVGFDNEDLGLDDLSPLHALSSGGVAFPSVLKILLVAQALFQFAAFAFFLGREAYGQMAISIVLFLLTLVLFRHIDTLAAKVFGSDLFVDRSEDEGDENDQDIDYTHPAFRILEGGKGGQGRMSDESGNDSSSSADPNSDDGSESNV